MNINVSIDNENYSSSEGILYDKLQNTLFCYPGGRTETLNIPHSVTKIGSNSFAHCTNLTVVTVPTTVTIIENFAFYNCSNIASVVIGSSVSAIGYDAFGRCNNLKSIICNSAVPPDIVIYNNTPERATFNGVPKDISVFIPCQTSLNYCNSNWSKVFSNIIEDC